jgi:hypothetical protein
MAEEVLKGFLEALDKAFPDIVAVRKVYLDYRAAHPELSSRLRDAFDEWLKKRYK